MLFYLILIGVGVLAGVLVNILINRGNLVYSVIGSVILLITGAIACFVLYYPYYFASFRNLIWTLVFVAVFLIAAYAALHVIVNAIRMRHGSPVLSDAPAIKAEPLYKTVRVQKSKPNKARKKMIGNVEVTRIKKASLQAANSKPEKPLKERALAIIQSGAAPSRAEAAARASQEPAGEVIGTMVIPDELLTKQKPAQPVIRKVTAESAQVETVEEITTEPASPEEITAAPAAAEEAVAEPVKTGAIEEITAEQVQAEAVEEVVAEPVQVETAEEEAAAESVQAEAAEEVIPEPAQTEAAEETAAESMQAEVAEEVIPEPAQTEAAEETAAEFMQIDVAEEVITEPGQTEAADEVAAESMQAEVAEEAIPEPVQTEAADEALSEPIPEPVEKAVIELTAAKEAAKPLQAETAEEAPAEPAQPSRFDALIAKAEELVKEGKYNYAAQIAEACLELAPPSQRKRADIMLLECLVLSNKIEQARKKWLEVLNKMYILEPNDKLKLKEILEKLNHSQKQVS